MLKIVTLAKFSIAIGIKVELMLKILKSKELGIFWVLLSQSMFQTSADSVLHDLFNCLLSKYLIHLASIQGGCNFLTVDHSLIKMSHTHIKGER